MAGETISIHKGGVLNSCHNPHTSEHPKLLVAQGNNLCFECHAEKNSKVQYPHAPVESTDGCLSCHNPHAAEFPGLVSAPPEGEHCLSCHQEIKTDLDKMAQQHQQHAEMEQIAK